MAQGNRPIWAVFLCPDFSAAPKHFPSLAHRQRPRLYSCYLPDRDRSVLGEAASLTPRTAANPYERHQAALDLVPRSAHKLALRRPFPQLRRERAPQSVPFFFGRPPKRKRGLGRPAGYIPSLTVIDGMGQSSSRNTLSVFATRPGPSASRSSRLLRVIRN